MQAKFGNIQCKIRLSFNWINNMALAHPLISLIGRVIKKVQDEKVVIVLITPIWKAQCWLTMINISGLDARGEEDRRLYDERRNGLRNKYQRYTKLGSLISRLGNILQFVIMVDESLTIEDTIGISINAASVGYSLHS
ncbi:MAG: hypothetical protein EZS28_014576 [Streblomastix strix]|uniref:Uncharacterized protein n=1 Tax=Streblomastix strix TaxID=222440 RepID=A0A5J4W4V4_9EUKA|nr:MAG: hypothetical protein EZS28_014576 [Streblomastix strix]